MPPTTYLFPDADITAMAAQAAAALPSAVNGRLEKAMRLVRSASVELHDDGSATVLSETDGLTGYRVAQGRCTCPDFQFQPAEVGGWCCHRIARSMVMRLQQAHATPTLESQATGEPFPIPAAPTALPAASTAVSVQQLPEAPASVNCYITIAGRQAQLTLRDTDERRLLARLAAVLKDYPAAAAPTPPQAAPQPQGEGTWCQKHHVALHVNHGKDGRTWLSHKTSEGQWCKGR